MWKGHHLSIEGIRMGYLFRQKWYLKGWGAGPRGGASLYKHLLIAPRGSLFVLTTIMRPFLERIGIVEDVSSYRSCHKTREWSPVIWARFRTICEVRNAFNNDPFHFQFVCRCVETWKEQGQLRNQLQVPSKRIFISRQNLGRSCKIPDRLEFSRHTKTRLLNRLW